MARKIKISKEKKKELEAQKKLREMENRNIISQNPSFYTLLYAMHSTAKLFIDNFGIFEQLKQGKVTEIKNDMLQGFEWLPTINMLDKALNKTYEKSHKELLNVPMVRRIYEVTTGIFYKENIQRWKKNIKSNCPEVRKALELVIRIISSFQTIQDCIYFPEIKINIQHRKYIRTMVTKFKNTLYEELVKTIEEVEYV